MYIGNDMKTNQMTGKPLQRETNDQMGRDEFLKILITQLRNQDPLNPMEDRDFIAQMAQFSTLEQIQNLGRDSIASKGLQLIGKMVYAEKYAEGTSHVQQVLGRVDQVTFIGGKPYLTVAGYDIGIDDIIQVLSEEEAKKIENAISDPQTDEGDQAVEGDESNG